MPRDSDLSDRHDGNESEGRQSGKESTGLSWVDDIVIPSGLPHDKKPEVNPYISEARPHEHQHQVAVGNVNTSLDHLLALRDAVEYFNKTYGKMAPARQRAMEQRAGLAYDKAQYSQRRKFFRESQEQYMDRFKSQDHPAALDSLRQQVEADDVALTLQDQRLRDAEGELSNTEFYLKNKEEALYKASEDLMEILRQVGVPFPVEPRDGVESYATRSPAMSLQLPSPEVNPILEDYYEKAGAIRWRQERADDARREYQNERSMRIFQQDHDEELEEDDEEFEANFRERFSHADAAVRVAIVDAQDARIACMNANLDPDAGLNLTLVESTEHASGLVTPSPQSIYFAAAPLTVPDVLSGGGNSSALLSTLTGNLHVDQPPPGQDLDDPEEAEDRIKKWMGTNTSEEFPFDDHFMEQHPRSRPQIYVSRSDHDLRYLSIDSRMMDIIPPHVRERLDPQPSTLHEKQGKAVLRRQRSSTDSRLALMEDRHDSGRGSISDPPSVRRKQ